jgi:hypothetical protein
MTCYCNFMLQPYRSQDESMFGSSVSMFQFDATQIFVWPCGDEVRLAPKFTSSLSSGICSWLLTAFSVLGPLHMIIKPCL